MSKTVSKPTDRWIGGVLVGLLVLVLALNAGWEVYRYGGQTYYMRVHQSSGTFPITVPVSLTVNGCRYRGRAVNAKGQTKKVQFKTNVDRPWSLRYGQIVKLTVNRHYGVTNFKPIKAQQVPKNVQLP